MAARSATLDMAKGLGICLVVLGHNWLSTHERGEIFRLIFSFHLPLFFFLSGVFIRQTDPLMGFMRARAVSLLKPYVVTLALLGLLKATSGKWSGDQRWSAAGHYAWGVVYGTGATLDWVPLWYLPHLFLALLLTLLLLKCTRPGWQRWGLACALVTLGAAILHAAWDGQGAPDTRGLPWSVDLLPVSMAFLLLGHECQQPVRTMRFDGQRWSLAALVFVVLLVCFDEFMDLNARLYGQTVLTTVQACLGVYLSLGAVCALQRFGAIRAALSYLGSGTIFILIFHAFIQSKVFDLIVARTARVDLACAGSFVAGLVLPLLLWEVVRRIPALSLLWLPRVRPV